MRGMNKLTIVAALARAAELRYTPGGTPVVEFTLAGKREADVRGELRRIPFYLRCSNIGKGAEAIAERLQNQVGAAVLVDVALEYSTWDAPDGGKRSMIKGKALRVELADLELGTLTDAGGAVRLAGGWNSCMIAGNLTADAELRYGPSGDAVLSFRVAVNESFTDRNNVRQDRVHFFEVVAFRSLAESLAKQLRKGSGVLVDGVAQSESWTDREGNKRSDMKVEARSITVLLGGASGQPKVEREVVAASGGGRASRGPARQVDQEVDAFPPEELDLPF